MLRFLLALVISAEYCNGQRRWAGSYSDTHSAEDTVTWDDRNYPRSDIEASTEANVRYGGKWPADNQKEQDTYGVSPPHHPPARDIQYGAGTDEGSRIETSQEEKGIYETPPEGRHMEPTPDEHNTREVDRRVIANDRENRFSNNRKGDVTAADEDQYSRHSIRRQKGDEGKASEVLPQERNQGRPLPPSRDHYGNRQQEDRNYPPAVKIAADDRTRPFARDHAKPRGEAKIGVPEDRNDRSRIDYKPNSEDGNADGMVPYYAGEPKGEISKVEESQNSRQERNNKGDVGALPQDRRQERYQPRRDYDDKQTATDVNYKEYGDTPGRHRPKDSEGQLTAREYIREGQPKIAGHDRDDADDHQNKGDRKENKQVYGSEVINTGRYNRSIMEPKQVGAERFVPVYNSGHRYDQKGEERTTAREYNSRREEELKQREYERRLEEETKKRQDETRGFNTKGEDERRRGGIHAGESERKGQPARGMGNKEEQNMKPEEPSANRRTEPTRSDIDRRNFETRKDNEGRKELGEEEEYYRETGEKRSGDPVYTRQENERGHGNVKGNIYVSTEGRLTIIRGVVRDNREQTNVHNSEGTQNDRTDGNQYSGRAKGETYNRESDYTVKNLNYNRNSSQPEVYRNSRQRTTNSTFDGPVATPVNGHHSRQENSRNRALEHSVVQNNSSSMINIQGNVENQRNRDGGKHNGSNRHGNVDPDQKAVYIRNPEELTGRDFKRTTTPSYANVDGLQARRTHSGREEYISSLPGYYKEEEKAVGVGSDVRQNRSVDRASSYPRATDDRSNSERPIRNSDTWKQGSANNNWKTESSPKEVYGYHPNISYDTIVFLDDKSEEEGNVWNLSNQKAEVPPTHTNQDEHKRQSTNTRETQGSSHYRVNVTSGASQFRRRNKRAPIDYPVQERATGTQQSEAEDHDGIHPDVVLLPGYTAAKPFSQRNYNDDVMDGDVEVFSEREIRVSARDYKRYGASFFSGIAADESKTSNSDSSAGKTG